MKQTVPALQRILMQYFYSIQDTHMKNSFTSYRPTRQLAASAACLAVMSVCFAFSGAAQAKPAKEEKAGAPHWSYHSSHGGPKTWGELNPSFETCGLGKTQSPVDIRNAVKADLPPLQTAYTATVPTIWNNGHTIQINLAPGNTLTVGDNKYELLQFHFHTPSEEAINGKRAPMVAHFVHKDAAGKLGVIGVLIDQGSKPNPAFAPIFAHLPKEGERITVDGLTLDVNALMPQDKSYYSFAGSLTTPPCSEGVNWMVLKNRISLGSKQIQAFRAIFAMNARPLQALNGREIRESR
jgi:carbonic anhydrase